MDPLDLSKILRRAVDDAKARGYLEEFEAQSIFRAITAVGSVMEDLGLTGVEAQASYIALRAWSQFVRAAISDALGNDRAKQLDRWADDVCGVLREKVPVMVDVQGKDPFGVGG